MILDLIRKLRAIGGVHTRNHSIAFMIKELIISKNVELISYKPADPFYNAHKNLVPIESDKTWCTFENLISTSFKVFNSEKLLCEITLYNGDYHGNQATERFNLGILLSIDFIEHIEWYINDRFLRIMKEEYEKHLEEERQKWIDENEGYFLKNFELKKGLWKYSEEDE